MTRAQIHRAVRSSVFVGLLAFACAGTQPWKPPTALDNRDDPATLRPGFGNRELHTWWPLTAPELVALRGMQRARQGDAHALLALAVLASGDHRDAASYDGYRQRVAQFVSDLGPSIAAAADDWHRGYELNRAMHRVFFNSERSELGNYQLDQSRITGIFHGGRYNCLSSAMMYAALARAFKLPVRAALVPTHVFIELGAPGGKIIEVETTSPTGFDWVHDERFYKQEAIAWSGRRGLRPVTLDEYRHRIHLDPYQLVANGMRNKHPGESTQDRSRLNEIAALVDPDDDDIQRARIEEYINEANDLHATKAWRTMVKFFDTVEPAVAELGARSKDGKTRGYASWVNWYFAHSLMIVGRQEEAIALMDIGLAHLDPGWQDAANLRANYINVLSNRLGELLTKKDYQGAVQTFTKYGDICRSDEVCSGNTGVVYANWSIEYQNAGDWQAARQVLRDCVAHLPSDGRCREALKDLESRHGF